MPQLKSKKITTYFFYHLPLTFSPIHRSISHWRVAFLTSVSRANTIYRHPHLLPFTIINLRTSYDTFVVRCTSATHMLSCCGVSMRCFYVLLSSCTKEILKSWSTQSFTRLLSLVLRAGLSELLKQFPMCCLCLAIISLNLSQSVRNFQEVTVIL